MFILKLASQFLVCTVFVAGLCNPANATIVSVDVHGHLTIIGTSGDDVVELHSHGEYSPWPHGLRIHYINVVGNPTVQSFNDVSSVEILTFAGNDTIFYYADYMGEFYIDTGSGNDNVRFYGNESNNSPFIWGNTTVITGSGEDDIRSSECCFWGELKIETGSNDDDVWLSNSLISELDVRTNQGSDWVQLWGCLVKRESNIFMGRDRDALNLARTTFEGPANFRGGHSNDDLGNHSEVTFLAFYIAQTFEDGNLAGFRK